MSVATSFKYHRPFPFCVTESAGRPANVTNAYLEGLTQAQAMEIYWNGRLTVASTTTQYFYGASAPSAPAGDSGLNQPNDRVCYKSGTDFLYGWQVSRPVNLELDDPFGYGYPPPAAPSDAGHSYLAKSISAFVIVPAFFWLDTNTSLYGVGFWGEISGEYVDLFSFDGIEWDSAFIDSGGWGFFYDDVGGNYFGATYASGVTVSLPWGNISANFGCNFTAGTPDTTVTVTDNSWTY